jgi:hypothetical protein
MVQPEDVRPTNFHDHQVLYNGDGFAISYGSYDNSAPCIGMRWNGESEAEDVGYPKLFKNPVWFVLPESLSLPILKAIIGLNGTNNDLILQKIRELITKV